MKDERDALIIRLWNEGLSARVVAERLGVSATLVSALILRRRASGEVTRLKRGLKNIERNYRIVDLWNKGYCTSEVARHVGCTKNAVLATIVKHRALGDITRPMVESRGDRGRLGIKARYGYRRKPATSKRMKA